MKKYDISQILLWLCFVIAAASAEETRLYSGVIQIPVMGPMEMTLGISETDNETKDLQVDANQNLSAIEAVKSSTGNDITIIELEGLNHLFQPATTGSIAEYAQIEITFDYDTLVLMGNWISEVTDAE